MSKCLLTIATATNDYKAVAVTVSNYFFDDDHAMDDYIQIMPAGSETVIFTKKNYIQIVNTTTKKEIRLALITDYLRNKCKNPLQGMLFE